MKIAFVVLAACAAAVATPAINQIRPVSNRPGRFLSLPNPQKCANSKWVFTCLIRFYGNWYRETAAIRNYLSEYS